MHITAQQILVFVGKAAHSIQTQRDYLTDLDAAIGDADHGINLDRGFSAVLIRLPDVADQDIGTILKTVGTTLVSTIGGASGPLYGTAFLRAGMTVAGRFTLSPEELVVALEAAMLGIQTRGKSMRGEKTMLDALAPAIDTLKATLASGDDLPIALCKSVNACETGMRSTIPMLATKGRASYLGERSIGHQDPGATSMFLLAQALLDTLDT
ncbi:MAG: dihydroxyacetone kinase subunit L [Candidatus Viridilinea halotolerans]|uniref:Dihydroxyacetone kinase subunit L n=1 Tax=Candidatus Viridilinea halotolerans TaxID=2491704 RepID=A0A426TUM5_9CHLR|nr:MAG: dihydroxyacetone kinase subunit L [Candidatus Viridilinea halotolerans]